MRVRVIVYTDSYLQRNTTRSGRSSNVCRPSNICKIYVYVYRKIRICIKINIYSMFNVCIYIYIYHIYVYNIYTCTNDMYIYIYTGSLPEVRRSSHDCLYIFTYIYMYVGIYILIIYIHMNIICIYTCT